MAKMKIGLSMLFCLSQPFSKLLKKLEKAPLKYIELIDDGWHKLSSDRIKKLKRVGETHALLFTLHAPFAGINIAAPDYDIRNFMLKRLKKSMILARQLGSNLFVFHPGRRTAISNFYPRMDWRNNIESVQELAKFSRKHEVAIAIENVPRKYGFLISRVEDFSSFFHELDNEEVGLALDIGHSHLEKQTLKFLNTFAERIVHIHAHDNKGEHDRHLGIGRGTIDWEQFTTNLKTSRFNGIIIVESYNNIDESVSKLQDLFA